jgi:hypothetical protein
MFFALNTKESEKQELSRRIRNETRSFLNFQMWFRSGGIDKSGEIYTQFFGLCQLKARISAAVDILRLSPVQRNYRYQKYHNSICHLNSVAML